MSAQPLVEGSVDLNAPPLAEQSPRIRMTVILDDNGDCRVVEHDLLHGIHRPAAVFPKEHRKVLLDDGQEAMMDVSQVRAITFATTWEALVNQGKVMLP